MFYDQGDPCFMNKMAKVLLSGWSMFYDEDGQSFMTVHV